MRRVRSFFSSYFRMRFHLFPSLFLNSLHHLSSGFPAILLYRVRLMPNLQLGGLTFVWTLPLDQSCMGQYRGITTQLTSLSTWWTCRPFLLVAWGYGRCGLESSSSGQESEIRFCEHGYEPSGLIRFVQKCIVMGKE
jgi:hypothetical protein